MGVSILTHKNLDTGRPQTTRPFDIPIANRRHHHLRFMTPHGDTALSSMSPYVDIIFSLHVASWRHHLLLSMPPHGDTTTPSPFHLMATPTLLSMSHHVNTTILSPCRKQATPPLSLHVANR
ncbi:hypothetical protein F2Q69_00034453 [Brassica cretica]|uniref:Uncharacterized protein n=1 Tax=Brassica cretica TaxID=69181 RepID=A0A8S9SPZ2_BRACR|nr:hypothetical protein F2Q69_00034453 [Brassica cretica]